MQIVHVEGAATGRIYPALDTGKQWNGCAVLAFAGDVLRGVIENADALDWNGYGLDLRDGALVDVSDEDTIEAIPTIAVRLDEVEHQLYVPDGRAWEILLRVSDEHPAVRP